MRRKRQAKKELRKKGKEQSKRRKFFWKHAFVFFTRAFWHLNKESKENRKKKRERREEKQKKEREREGKEEKLRRMFGKVFILLVYWFYFAKPLPQNAPNPWKTR